MPRRCRKQTLALGSDRRPEHVAFRIAIEQARCGHISGGVANQSVGFSSAARAGLDAGIGRAVGGDRGASEVIVARLEATPGMTAGAFHSGASGRRAARD